MYIDIPNPNDYIRSNRRMKVRIRNQVKIQNAPNGFISRIDHVHLEVTP